MAHFHLQALGGLRLLSASGEESGLLSSKPLALLLLVSLSPEGVNRDYAAQLLWPGDRSARSRQSLRQAVFALRRALGEDAFAGEDPLALRAGLLTVDVAELDSALREGRLEDALPLWQGAFLSGFDLPGISEWSEWAESWRARLEHDFGAALRSRAQADRNAGELDSAQHWLEEAVRIQPLAVDGWTALVTLLAERREAARAASVLARARQALAGTEKEGELRVLEERVRRLEARPDAPASESGVPSAFVGRTREFAALLGLWRKACAGSTRLAVLSGPTGIGKTRLVEEVGKAAADDDGGIVHVKASEAERTLDGALVATLVERLLEQRGAAGITVASDRLLRTLLPSRDTQGSPGGTIQFSSAIADALRDLIGAVSYERPLLLHLDDLHWADAPSRTLVLAALARLRESPVLAVLTVRLDSADEDTRRALRSFVESREAWETALEPLSHSETIELLTHTLDATADSPVLQRIARAVGGNPLFAVELLRAFREQGLLQARSGRWWLRAEDLPAELRLPASVQDVIEQRLSQLSADAQVVAGALARQPREVSLGKLGRWSALRPGALTRAANELLTRGVVRWEGPEAIDFAHDQMRAIARERYGSLGPLRTRRRVAIGLGVVLLANMAAAGYWITRRPGAPLYGGGVLYANLADSVVALAPGTHTRPEWHRREVNPPVPPAPFIFGPFPTTTGDPVWIHDVSGISTAPYIVRLFRDSVHVLARQDRADANVGSVSPDGSEVVYQIENTTTRKYDDNLVVAHIDGSAPRILYQAPERLTRAQWAPDGHAIAVVIYGRPDTVAIFSPRGRRLGSVPLPEANGLSWCGGNRWLSLTFRDGADRRLARLDTRTLRVEPLPGPPTLVLTACSPNASAIAFQGIAAGQAALLLHDLTTGRITRLPITSVPQSMRWNPQRVEPVPASVRIIEPPETLAWGDTRTLRAATTYTDGGVRAVPVEWATSDPAVIAVEEGGHAIANRPGKAWLSATVGGWRTDSVLITVPQVRAPLGALLQDPFDGIALDSGRWQAIGLPAPVPARVQGETALSMRGDGMYLDGVLSRDAIELPRGATLEAEFRLRVTRPDRQRFGLCLQESELRPGRNPADMESWAQRQQACLSYPAGELLRFDSLELSLAANGAPRLIRLPGDLPPRGWIHFALELRPDGVCAGFVNHRFVGQAPIRLDNEPRTRWRVLIIGSAVETNLFVRNLLLRSGAQHAVTGEGH